MKGKNQNGLDRARKYLNNEKGLNRLKKEKKMYDSSCMRLMNLEYFVPISSIFANFLLFHNLVFSVFCLSHIFFSNLPISYIHDLFSSSLFSS